MRTGEAAVLTRVLRDMLDGHPSDDGHQGSGLYGTAAQLAEAEEKLDSVASVVKDNLRRFREIIKRSVSFFLGSHLNPNKAAVSGMLNLNSRFLCVFMVLGRVINRSENIDALLDKTSDLSSQVKRRRKNIYTWNLSPIFVSYVLVFKECVCVTLVTQP